MYNLREFFTRKGGGQNASPLSRKLLAFLSLAALLTAGIPVANAAADQSNGKGQNLLPRSQDWSATWGLSSVTALANATIAPDGTNTATKMIETGATTADHYVFQNTFTTIAAGRVGTASLYVKSAERQYIQLTFVDTSSNIYRTVFDATGGTVVSTAVGITSSITHLANGWNRISITLTAVAAINQIAIIVQATGTYGSYTGDPTKGIYIWGAQLVVGSKPGAYNRTAASALNTSYTPAGASQSNQKGQNLLTYSQNLTGSGWTSDGIGTTRTANYATAPDGTMTASRVVFAAGGAYIFNFANGSGVPMSLGPATISAWIKQTSGTAKLRFRLQSTLGTVNVTSPDITATSVWTRVSFSTTVTNIGLGSLTAAFILNDAAGDTSDVLIWGVQIENSPNAKAYNRTTASALNTSYIPSGARQSSLKGQNVITYSEQFDNAAWTTINGSISANTTTAPIGGTITADALVEDTSTAPHRVNNATPSSGFLVTQSIYAKAVNRTWIAFYGKGGGVGAYFNLSTCAVGTVGGLLGWSAKPAGNGWCRLSIKYVDDGAGMAIYAATGDGASVTYAGNGLPAYYLWGAQVEKSAKLGAYNRTGANAVNP